jgi:hypothetical protein
MTGKIIGGVPRAPHYISPIAYEIHSSGQHRTAQIAGPLRMHDCHECYRDTSALLSADSGRCVHDS